MSCYIVQEVDGVGRFTLEDGSGFLVLDNCVPGVLPPGVGGTGPIRGSRRRPRNQYVLDEDEPLIAVILDNL